MAPDSGRPPSDSLAERISRRADRWYQRRLASLIVLPIGLTFTIIAAYLLWNYGLLGLFIISGVLVALFPLAALWYRVTQ